MVRPRRERSGANFVTYESILAVLKFGGPIVGLIAALWSTTQKITYETEDGVKRLTRQGRVLIGIVAVSALISIFALGVETIVAKQHAQKAADEAGTARAEFERINYPLRSIEVEAELSLNLEGVDMADFWKEIEANKSLHRDESRYGPGHIVTLHLSDFSTAPHHSDDLRYATLATQIRLLFVTPEAAFNRPGKPDEITPIKAPGPGSGQVSVALEFGTIEADLDDRTMTASFGGKYEVPDIGLADSGDRLSVPAVDKLVPILIIHRSSTHSRRPDTLLRVAFSVNDTGRFQAWPRVNIADEGAFILHPQSPRR